MPLPHGEAPGVAAGGRLTGRWRYDRTAARGIALSYDPAVSGLPAVRLPDVHSGGRFTGRWRYNRSARCGIALSYDRGVPAPPPAAPPVPEPIRPATIHSPMVVRVLCTCGEFFTFEGYAALCPGCGRPASWPTMGQVEQEMRADLEELVRDHERGTDPG